MARGAWLEPVMSGLLHIAERAEVDQSTLFTPGQDTLQKALAMAASILSIIFCLAAIYMFIAIDPKRLVFRHHLIAFLIFFDLLKATILLIFPARVLSDASSYASNTFCQVVGFFTATSIEGADLAILAFAIHTFLLIFKPGLSVKIKDSDRVEGGLYRFRYYIYGPSFVIPLAMASFPYIGVGYKSFVCWCYLPQQPFWYRAVLSWVPRYIIVIVILTVYVSIYIHVLREFRTLGGAFTTMHRSRQKLAPSKSYDKPTFFSALKFFLRDVRDYILPKLILPESVTKSITESGSSESNINDTRSKERDAESPTEPVDCERAIGETQFQAANLESFRKRQRIIEKQMKSIFIYPIAYISIWLFPFILYCTQFHYEENHGPVVWLNCVAAFMQPFIGFVDSCVFFFREEPWKYTIMKNFEKENTKRLDTIVARGSSFGDVESLSASARLTNSSIALSSRVNLNDFSRFRRFMSKCRFPFMSLPSEENVAKFQALYFKRASEHAAKDPNRNRYRSAVAPGDFGGLQAKHDFSNLLDGNDFSDELPQTFHGYTLSFNEGSRKSVASGNMPGTQGTGERRPSVASLSNKSAPSRRYSAFDDRDPIPENGHYKPQTPRAPRVGSNSQRKSLQNSGNSSMDDGELDLLDFLRRGPK